MRGILSGLRGRMGMGVRVMVSVDDVGDAAGRDNTTKAAFVLGLRVIRKGYGEARGASTTEIGW